MSLGFQHSSEEQVQPGQEKAFEQSHCYIPAVPCYWLGVAHGMRGCGANAMLDWRR